MLNYLWEKDGKYYGLDGSVYNTEPTIEEVAALQEYSRQFMNDKTGYENAFNQNVASVLGAPASDNFEDDSSCHPLLCPVRVNYYEDDGGTRVSAITESGGDCYQLTLNFYNLAPKSASVNLGHSVKYAYGSSITETDCVAQLRGNEWYDCRGDRTWIGVCFSSKSEDIRNPQKYAWFELGSGGGSGSQGVRTSYAFKRTPTIYGSSYTPYDMPQGGTYDDPNPTNDWSLSVTGNMLYPVWMSVGTCRPGESYVWQKPAKMSDSKTFQTEWADSSADGFYQDYLSGLKNLPSLNDYLDPTDVYEGIDEGSWRAAALSQGCGVWGDQANNAKYMAMSNCASGVWGPWSVVKIAGSDGAPGKSATQTAMAFANVKKDYTRETSTEITNVPLAPIGGYYDPNEGEVYNIRTAPDDAALGISWSTDNNNRADDEYTWYSTAKFDVDNGNIIGTWSEPVRITGDDGIDGTDSSGREYIFKRFATKEDFEAYDTSEDNEFPCSIGRCYEECEDYQNDDFCPTGWTDHPLGITHDEWRVEACCVRVLKNDEWQPYTQPFIWASWGDDGIDGDGVEYIYLITTHADCDYVVVEDPSKMGDVTWVEKEELPESCNKNTENYIKVSGVYYAKSYTFPSDLFQYNPRNIINKINEKYRPDAGPDSEEYKRNRILTEYYQGSDFIPGNKVLDDIDNEDGTSYLWVVTKKYKPEFKNSTPGNPNGIIEYLNEIAAWLDWNWTDNPLDVGPNQPFEWVSTRKYKHDTHDNEKIWEDFSEPSLWNNWAFDGVSVFTSMVFCRTNDDISGMRLCGGTFEFPMPGANKNYLTGGSSSCETTNCVVVFDGVKSTVKYKAPGETTYKYYVFSDTVPESENNANESIWMAMSIFGDEETSEDQEWTSPSRMSDTSDFNVEWCNSETLTQTQINRIKTSELNFGNFTKLYEDDPEETPDHIKAEAAWEEYMEQSGLGSWSDTGDNAVWMATTTYHNGKWSNWTVSKVKGEKGDAGTSLKVMGSTFLVVSGMTELDQVTGLTEEQIGGYIGVVCVDNTDPRVCTDTQSGRLEIVRYDGLDENNQYIFKTLSCEKDWELEKTVSSIVEEVPYNHVASVSTFEEAENIKAQANEQGVFPGAPGEMDRDSLYVVIVSNTDFYKLYYRNVLNESDTIIINGIEEYADPNGNQKHSSDELGSGCEGVGHEGVMNGDFFVWDSDSWRKTANLLGQASYVHIKFADAKTFNGEYYRLTLPDSQHQNHGEAMGDYMGMYVDSKKQDNTGTTWGNETTPGEEPFTRVWCKMNSPYQFERVVGNDGLGYEYIYIRTTGDTKGNNEQNSCPFVPMFEPEFYETEEYQENDWYPGKPGTTPIANLPWVNGSSTSGRAENWTDNAISCDVQYRYRWRCQREKVNGKWGPFIGDKSTATETYVNGKYASFDANCAEELLVADFSNDFLPVHIFKDAGNVIERVTYVVTPILKQGGREFTVTSVTFESKTGISTRKVGSNYEVTIGTNFVFGDNNYSETLSATINGYDENNIQKSGVAVLTIIGVKSDTIYNLVPSLTAIKKNPVTGAFSSTTLTCDVLKKVIGGETSTIGHSSFDDNGVYNNGECTIKFKYDNQSTLVGMKDGTIVLNNLSPKLEDLVILEVYDKDNILNDRETIYVQADGTSAFQADFDNESESIPLTYEGAVDRNGTEVRVGGYDYLTITSRVTLYYGIKELNIVTIKARLASESGEGRAITTSPTQLSSVYGDNVLVSLTDTGNNFDVTFYFKCDWVCPDVFNFCVLVQGDPNVDKELHIASMTISGIKSGQPGEKARIYNIHPSDSVIVRKKNGTTRDPETLTCYIQERIGSATTVYSTAAQINEILSQTGYKIQYVIDNGGNQDYNPASGVSCSAVTNNVTFKLVKVSGGNLIDTEKVPLVEDGYDGNGIIAHCQYYVTTDTDNVSTINSQFVPSTYGVTSSCNINGQSRPVTMIGNYIANQTSKTPTPAPGTSVPTPNSQYKYLWKREITWYSIEGPYLSSSEMITEDGKEVSGSDCFYISGETTDADTVKGYWDTVSGQTTGSNARSKALQLGFSLTDPTGTLQKGWSVWTFTLIYYNDDTFTILPLTVARSVEKIPDLEMLTSVFGEADVEAKKGAYLRQFLGVMDSGKSSPFENGDVEAFLNATNNWSDPTYGRLVFASGVSNLGGDGQTIDMDDFEATTKIWENGRLECTEADIEGTIKANAGRFGNDSSYFSITENGIAGISDTTEYFKLGSGGLTANSATINGEINANSGKIGCLIVNEDGTISHERNDLLEGTFGGKNIAGKYELIYLDKSESYKNFELKKNGWLETVYHDLYFWGGNKYTESTRNFTPTILQYIQHQGITKPSIVTGVTPGNIGEFSGIDGVVSSYSQLPPASSMGNATIYNINSAHTVSGVSYEAGTNWISNGEKWEPVKVHDKYTKSSYITIDNNISILYDGDTASQIKLYSSGIELVQNDWSVRDSDDGNYYKLSGYLQQDAFRGNDYFCYGKTSPTATTTSSSTVGRTSTTVTTKERVKNVNSVLSSEEIDMSVKKYLLTTKNTTTKYTSRTDTAVTTSQTEVTDYHLSIKPNLIKLDEGNIELSKGDVLLSNGSVSIINPDTGEHVSSIEKQKFYLKSGTIELDSGVMYVGESIGEDGYIYISAIKNGTANIALFGDGNFVQARNFYTTSDARLKELGEPLKDVLNKIDRIDTLYYTFKDDKTKTFKIGTTAQSLLDVYPELVKNNNDVYSVDYSKLSIIAIAAIKELKKKVEELEETIKKLTNKE